MVFMKKLLLDKHNAEITVLKGGISLEEAEHPDFPLHELIEVVPETPIVLLSLDYTAEDLAEGKEIPVTEIWLWTEQDAAWECYLQIAKDKIFVPDLPEFTANFDYTEVAPGRIEPTEKKVI